MKLQSGQLLFAVLTAVIVSGFVMPAFAVQLDTLLIPQRGKADAFYKAIKVVYLEYPNGGQLQSLLEGEKGQIRFLADKDTPGVQTLIDMINKNLVSDKNSPVIVEDVKIDYRTTLDADERRAVLEHNLKMAVILTNFVLHAGSASEGTLIDLNWRGLYIDEPVVITTEEYGDVEINFPSGFYYAKYPEVMELVEGTKAMNILNSPSMDFRTLTDLSIDNWHWLFDPTGSIRESEQFGFREVEGANVITFFAMGEGSLREGVVREVSVKEEFTVDGTNYVVRRTAPPTSATIQVAGYATESIQGSDEGALVFDHVPEGAGKSYTGGFPIVVLAVLGGLMGAVAGFVLWRANKKD